MDILIAKHSGFCEGVERAYQIALKQIGSGYPVFMLGNLVHNTQVVEKFKGLGVKTVKTLSEIEPGSQGILLISAHGVSPEIYVQAQKLGLTIMDTTCPWVKKAQKIAKDLAEAGRLVIIVGDLGHPEVKALLGWSGGKGVVVENSGAIGKLTLPSGEKIGILAQTTQAQENFDSVVNKIKEKFPNVEVHNTICGATAKRQAAAVEAARQVELMLVVGDKMSANTKRLTELCSQTGTETHQIQSVGELNASWLINKRKVGVTAGASTPEWVIEEVIARLRAQ
jgi:small subunit ribosomal protein S1